MPILLSSKKEYIGIIHLHKDVNRKEVEKVFKTFIGKVKQLPPVKSAVARKEREREIYYLELLEIKGRNVLFKISCEAGFYVRRFCLTPDTEIILSNGGSQTIQSFVNNYDFKIHKISAFNLNTNKLENCKILGMQKIPAPKKLVELFTDSGIKLKFTQDHEILIDTEEGPKWIEAKNLKKGAYVYSPRKIIVDEKQPLILDLLDDNIMIDNKEIKDLCKILAIRKYGSIRQMKRKAKFNRQLFYRNKGLRIKYLKEICGDKWEELKYKISKIKTENGMKIELNSKRLNENIMYLLGLIASDGWVLREKGCTRPNRIFFSNTEFELISKFKEIHENEFPNLKSNISKSGDVYTIDFHNIVLAGIAYSLGIKSPNQKSDFKPIIRSTENLIEAFLKGYFDGDGGISISKNKISLRYFTSNYNNAKNLFKLLKRLGIRSKIYRAFNNTGFIERNDKYLLQIVSPSDKVLFSEIIGSNHPIKLKKLNKVKKLLNRYREEGDLDYISLQAKKFIKNLIKKYNLKLYRLGFGGSVYSYFNNNKPLTRFIVKKFLNSVKNVICREEYLFLEKIISSECYLESIKKVKIIDSKVKYVYDITVDKLHNFIPEGVMIVSNCDDVGKRLGIGAHLQELRRTKSGSFSEESAVTLQNLFDALGNEEKLREIILPMEIVIESIGKVVISDNAIDNICNGAPLAVGGIVRLEDKIKKGDWTAMLSLKGELVAIGKALLSSKEILEKNKGLAIKTDRVLMKKGTYSF